MIKIRKAMIALRQSYELLAELLPEERGAQLTSSLESEETVNKIRQVVTDVFGVDPARSAKRRNGFSSSCVPIFASLYYA